ncbi:MAG: alpha/beta fold hydrolase [Candidatus Solibacter usitatus]|nr:alpha/beta fold hydrolase [Candidatus Solibacter usitatus]
MRPLIRQAGLILALALSAWGQRAPIEGSWEGVIQSVMGKLRIRIHVTRSPDGTLSGKMDSPDQGAFGLPVSSVTFETGVLKWELKMANASFEGKLNEAGSEIEGKFKQGMELPLTLKRFEGSPEPNRPQNPKPPLPYRSEDVTFASKAAGVTMAGTLTLPPGRGPFPAVVLITGSGPQDRDESLMGHKPFLVLSDRLTRGGIAVLRYDDRGVGKSSGSFAKATSADFAEDAEGALEYLQSRPEIDAKRIGLAGHSEGGIIAPMLAARRSGIAFVVLLAGTAVPGADVVLEQGQRMAELAGAPEAARKQGREKQLEIYEALRASKDDAGIEKQLKALLGDEPAAQAQIRQVLSPWFRYFLFYDPAPALAKLKCPVLVLNGEKDVQVLADQNLPPLEAALKKGGNRDYRIVRLPGLNHLFQTAKTGLPAEYAQIEETMAPSMLEALTLWIRQHTGLESKQ